MDKTTSMLPGLTERQRLVYEFIEDRIRTWGYPPTIREIGEHLGIRSTNGVADHLKALKRKGYLTQQGMKSRTLQPLRPMDGQDGVQPIRVPPGTENAQFATTEVALLGRVAAGEPILAEEHAEGTIIMDNAVLGVPKGNVFALRVVGDSMIDDGILDGDLIFVRRQSHAEAGNIVVVEIDNEATVKRFYPEADRIRLQPANPRMEPIYINKSQARRVAIAGVVVGVCRTLETKHTHQMDIPQPPR